MDSTALRWGSLALITACSPSAAHGIAPIGSAAPAHAAHAYRYDLVITGPEANGTTKLALDLSDAAPSSVMFGKNVRTAASNRADVGVKLLARLTREGDTPRLEIDASIGSVDAAGKMRRVTLNGTALTPLGASTVVSETSQDGRVVRVTATPTALRALGDGAPDGAYLVDVLVSHAAARSGTTTPLALRIDGRRPAIAKQIDSVPLQVSGGGGVGSPRQDTGTVVKAVAHAHARGLALDLQLELSGPETGPSAFTIRKIVSQTSALAPFDKETTVLVAEEDGHRYEVTVTPHRAR